jgi:hypothetical protein
MANPTARLRRPAREVILLDALTVAQRELRDWYEFASEPNNTVAPTAKTETAAVLAVIDAAFAAIQRRIER